MNERRISTEKLPKETSTNSGDAKYNSWNENIHQIGSTADVSGQRRDSVNSKTEQLRLSSVMRKRRIANPELGLYIYGWLNFLTRVTRPLNGEKYLSSKWCWDNRYPFIKNWIWFIFNSFAKKWIWNLKNHIIY